MFPKTISHVFVPPIKCQGIKTKLVNFISEGIEWDESGLWIEPFLGSGVVLFKIFPGRAIVSDKNEHIIRFYQDIQSQQITAATAREFLEYHGAALSNHGESYYYEMRAAFNKSHDPLHFLFLSRACFNGVMRFNKKGEFNVPFCKKDNRFRKAYVTKICNQLQQTADVILSHDWTFRACDWRETIVSAQEGDFVYLDPPYIGRDTGYIGEWTAQDAIDLSLYAKQCAGKVALSMWKENKYRSNEHLNACWQEFDMKQFNHFYHVGASEQLRNKMIECLMTKSP